MRRGMCRALLVAAAVLLFICSCDKRPPTPTEPSPQPFEFDTAPTAPITFLSTQLNPVEEAGKMRTSILRDFPGSVDFRPNDNNWLFNQIEAELKSDHAAAILVGALHGDLARLHEEGALRPLGDLFASLGDRDFPETLAGMSLLDGKEPYYIPWLQATFVMTANKKALPYLPKGAALDRLTYGELLQWGRTIREKTGKKAIGFPAGGKGLFHRFFQGYLYPSFTGGTLLPFRGAEARTMWEYFRDLWQVVQPGSLNYSTMAEPLLAEDVWIAWDHTARLAKVFETRGEDFVAFPAPAGPKGRGFMSVISGLAIPAAVKDAENPAILIDYLTRPEIQLRTLRDVGFFPVVRLKDETGIPENLRSLSRAVADQSSSLNPVPTLLPVGLGSRAGDFNALYTLTFAEIVLEEKDVGSVLDANAAELQRIIDAENARCWLPDRSEERPCKIE